MKFNIDIKNFGKIKEAKINIRPFTVIAGPNSSGKSFVTKALYSFFNTINNDHVTSSAFDSITKIKNLALSIGYQLARPSLTEQLLHRDLINSIEQVEKIIDEEFRANTLTQQISGMELLSVACKNVFSNFDNFRNEVHGKVKFKKVSATFDAIKIILNSLSNLTNKPNNFLGDEIEKGFINELKENFQVSKLSDLKNFNADNDSEICFDFDSLGSIHINNERLSFKLTHTSIDDFQKLYNVVYLESPIYWKLKDSLDTLRSNKKYFSFLARQKNDILSGVPKHFYDLFDLLKNRAKDEKSICDSPFSKSIKQAIGGEILISPTSDIVFREKGSPRAVGLHSTALGVTNLGIISLLLERGIISEGSYLFIDEPEVNLHPSWQKIMIETLFELSTHGISVVIASHSIDMMKCIENIMDSNPILVSEEHFGINQLTSDGYSVAESTNPMKRIAAIKSDLGKPFYDMFIDGEL
ncbi:AAA family ATPase [Yersinia enterocolitica]|nr:AAA family ATPase [Yersinia enterocolitica]EKN4847054.1 AAA family ATPase [Yersinia enterocolitica]EKN5118383.1 hypothetical protein [Yersinia enterocolitica]ELI7924270.1 AAA family ATPase [Yersinia enterocolitica]HDM8429153.1 AAA family ATPase [Yersinia enterocolitica]